MNAHKPLVIVDVDDSVIGPEADFWKVHREGIPHRSVHFEIVDDQGRYLIRSRNDDRYEILGGHVDWLVEENRAETYEEAALRELAEELNLIANGLLLSDLRGRLIDTHKIINQVPSSHWNNNEWVTVFSPTFAIGWVGNCQLLCFQQPASKGLHYIFSWCRDSSERAAMRGGGWFGSVSLS